MGVLLEVDFAICLNKLRISCIKLGCTIIKLVRFSTMCVNF